MVGMMLAGVVARWDADRHEYARQRRHGLPSLLNVTYQCTGSAFVVRTPGSTYEAEWPTISVVLVAPGYWVLVVQGQPIYLPRKVFRALGEERAFMATVLAALTPEAQERSVDLRAFLKQQDGAAGSPPTTAPS